MADVLPTTTTATTQIAPAYLYAEYADDDSLQALFAAWNSLAQGYLDWFNQTPLAVYTSQGISGPLLDWTAQGIYGISRPTLSTLSSRSYGAYNTIAYNSLAYNARKQVNTGTVQIATDDIYKRVLTWWLYRGDGKQVSILWLKRRVCRFLYGVNGTDISYPIGPQAAPVSAPTLSSVSGGSLGAATYYAKVTYTCAGGETTASPENSLAVAADNLLVVQSPPASGIATGYNVYAATSSGTETKQNSVPIAIGTNWTEPTSGLISGSAPPTINTAGPVSITVSGGAFTIKIPDNQIGQIFQLCVNNGVLSLPFLNTFTVALS